MLNLILLAFLLAQLLFRYIVQVRLVDDDDDDRDDGGRNNYIERYMTIALNEK